MKKVSDSINKNKRSLTLDIALEEKIRKIQAKLIEETGKSWSMSKIVNLLLSCGIIATSKLSHDDWIQIKSTLQGKSVSFDKNKLKIFVDKISQ